MDEVSEQTAIWIYEDKVDIKYIHVNKKENENKTMCSPFPLSFVQLKRKLDKQFG